MLSLLIVVFLFALHAECEVVKDVHFTKCNEYFYKTHPPSGFPTQNIEQICQRYQNKYHFATLYSKDNRIPLYSAYRLDTVSCPANQPDRRNTWFVEPQLSGNGYSKDMGTAGPSTNTFKQVQAINGDFRNTNYDRGHLNPNFYQCYDGRTATFTLTNAVPQDPCFNQNLWKEMETTSKSIMTELCSFAGAKRYFVTGAVPTNKKIPSVLDDKEGDEHREYNRVSVPSVMWTAACCDSSSAPNPNDKQKGFSFGYYGENIPDSWVIPASVSTLQNKLATLYHLQVLDIFVDSCFENSENSKKAFQKVAVPLNKKVAETLLDMSKSSESSMPPSKRRAIETIDKTLNQNNAIVQQDWKFSDAEMGMECERVDHQTTSAQLLGKGLSMVLTSPNSELRWNKATKDLVRVGNNSPYPLTELDMTPENKQNNVFDYKDNYSGKKPNVWEQFVDRVHSTIQSDKQLEYKENQRDDFDTKSTNLDAAITDSYEVVSSTSNTRSAMGDRCRDNHPCGLHGHKYYWCYIDWSNNWDYCCKDECNFRGSSYQWCHSGSKWAYCSPPYSRITISGKSCRLDHECGRHNENYFWCYTDKEKNWDYCCQPWHDCLTHGSSYKWCYTGYKKKQTWKKCNY